MGLLSARVRAYLQLEEAAGAFTDTGPNTYAVTNNNAVASTGSGKLANGASFAGGTSNGTAPYLSLPTGLLSTLAITTFSCWVNLAAVTAQQRVLEYGGGTGFFSVLATNATPRIQATFNDGTNTYTAIHSANTVISTWYHIVVTICRGNMGLWVNGVNSANVTISTAALQHSLLTVASPTRLWIGRSATSADAALNGILDEWSVFDTVLTPTEIARIYNTGTGRNKAAVDAIDAITFGFVGKPHIKLIQNQTPPRIIRTGFEGGKGEAIRPTSGIILPRTGFGRRV